MKATAKACSNIALVKYWGKRDATLNLPQAGSLSLTLDALATFTSVEFFDGDTDSLTLNGSPANAEDLKRASKFIDLVRDIASSDKRARIRSVNTFPTASGLASSASAFAALAIASTKALGIDITPKELSVLARRGSGSAARSVYGGAVEMHAGEKADGSDSYAAAVDSLADWPLVMVVAIVGGGVRKGISSTQAMNRSRDTSPLHDAWIASVPGDLNLAKAAIAKRSLSELGAVMEGSACAMHAAALAARPSIRYWQPQTVECMTVVERLRSSGVDAFYTMDAGPHVKILTRENDAPSVKEAIAKVAGVTDVLVSKLGQGVSIIEKVPEGVLL